MEKISNTEKMINHLACMVALDAGDLTGYYFTQIKYTQFFSFFVFNVLIIL